MKVIAAMFLAAGFEEKVKEDLTRGRDISTRDLLIGLTVALVIGFAIALWMYLRARKRTDREDQERIRQMMRGHSDGQGDSLEKLPDGRHRRRKRRRRRDHRPRNPPLSETGGLPPPRPDDQLPKY